MKTKRILTIIMAVIMLIGTLPTSIFASTYTVTLHCGPEGTGNSVTLTKTAGEPLALAHSRADITAQYGFVPNGGSSDQRFFIKWSTSYDPTTSRGTGDDYYDSYTADADATLYAIWGFEIVYNADGGVYPDGTTKHENYVCNYNGSNYNDPKTVYGLHGFPEGANAPIKEGCRRVVMNNSKGNDFFALLKSSKAMFTTETAAQNLTIPPTGGAMEWSVFNCTTTAKGNPAPEFYAIWEPSVTYDPNGGEGESYSEYLEWSWDRLWKYETYTIDSNSFTKNNGVTFTGWNTEPDGTGKAYAAGKKVVNFGNNSDPVTLYAQWSDGSNGLHKHSYELSYTEEPACATDGINRYTCICGDFYEETIPATGEHSYGEWTVILDPTYFEAGREVRVCSVCDTAEEQDVPVKEYINAFEDISDTAWYADEVAYCVKKGYMSGMSSTVFSPGTPVTREQFVLILANMAGVDTNEYKYTDSGMSDVPTGYWFSGAVAWAVQEGYVKGVSEGVFGRGQAITRSQLARLFYLYAETLGMDMTVEEDCLADFTDKAKVRSWAYDNIQWAVKVGLISGVSEGVLSPNTTATRAQCARMIMIFDTLK